MRTIAVLNQKGGVGKTTTVVNTAAALASMGARVLAIDLDPQAHLTIHLGLEPQQTAAGSYKVLTQSARLEQEVLMTRLNLWVLPANINLVGAETELVSVVGRETILREALEQADKLFDYCFIDCPPSLGLLTLNALAAAGEVLIPLQPHFLALQGFGKLLQTVELVNRRINPALRVEGVLLCMFDTTASLPAEVRADIERFLDQARGTNCAWSHARILPTFIRRNIKLAEAPSYGKTIFEYERNCNGAEDYRKVAEFIWSRSELTRQPRAAGSAPQSIREIPPAPRPVPRPVEPLQQAEPAGMPRPETTPDRPDAPPVNRLGNPTAVRQPMPPGTAPEPAARPVPVSSGKYEYHRPVQQQRVLPARPPAAGNPGTAPQAQRRPQSQPMPRRPATTKPTPTVSADPVANPGQRQAPVRPHRQGLRAPSAGQPTETRQNQPRPLIPIKQVPPPVPKPPEPVRRADGQPDGKSTSGDG